MTRLTRNQWIFAVIFAVYTATFHYLLNKTIDTGRHESIWILATGYGGLTFLTALLIGAFDPVRQSRGVMSFQYNMITYVTSVIIWLTFLFTGLATKEAGSNVYLLGVAFWGLGVFIHYLSSRSTLKGIPKKEMFD